MKFPKWATTVTPLSKTIALILFITLPIVGFYLGLAFQQGDSLTNREPVERVRIIKPTSVLSPSINQAMPIDILPIQPETRGDIPQFVELLRDAYVKKDIGICNSLPIPKPQRFSFDDYEMSAPSLNQWKGYCVALVNKNAVLCDNIDRFSHPNLQEECQYALKKSYSKN